MRISLPEAKETPARNYPGSGRAALMLFFNQNDEQRGIFIAGSKEILACAVECDSFGAANNAAEISAVHIN